MALWLHAWDGDHAGKLAGRQPNRLLISLTDTDYSYPPALYRKGSLYGFPWYFNLNVVCLTPNARHPIVTAVEYLSSNVYALDLIEVDWLLNRNPWAPGVHLFSVSLWDGRGNNSSTIGTALIDDSLIRITYQPEEPPIDLMLTLMQAQPGGMPFPAPAG